MLHQKEEEEKKKGRKYYCPMEWKKHIKTSENQNCNDSLLETLA